MTGGPPIYRGEHGRKENASPRWSTKSHGARTPTCLPKSGGRGMKVGFRADADLDGRVPRGLRRAAREIDIRSAADARLAGVPDIEV